MYRSLSGALDLLLRHHYQPDSQQQSHRGSHSSHRPGVHHAKTKRPERISRALSGALDLLLHQCPQQSKQSRRHTRSQHQPHLLVAGGPERISRTLSGTLDLLLRQGHQQSAQGQEHSCSQHSHRSVLAAHSSLAQQVPLRPLPRSQEPHKCPRWPQCSHPPWCCTELL